MSAASIRRASLAEFECAAELRHRMAREMGRDWDRDHPGWRERYAEFFRDRQRRGDAQLVLAECEGAIVGMAIFSVTDEYRRHTFGQLRGYVNGVFVDPAVRRRGIGRALLLDGLAWLRERGCTGVRLRASEEGRSLYETLGFVSGTEMELSL